MTCLAGESRKAGKGFGSTFEAKRRFERGGLNFVHLSDESFALTDVTAISVSHDGSGNAPDWHLASITLRKRGEADRSVNFDRIVKAGVSERVVT